MRAARECRRFQFQGTQLFSQGAKQGISLLVLMTYLTLISAPAAAAVHQEVFGRPKPLTESSIAQSELAQLRETMRQFRLEQRLAARAPETATDKLKALFTDSPRVKAERALADSLLAAKARLLSEAAQQDQELAATRADLLNKKLPASILARHDAAMQTIQQRRSELLGQLDHLQQTQADDDDGERAQLLNAIDKTLEAWGGKQAAKTDYKHLPWGSPDSKARAPHTSEFAYLGHLELFGIKPLQLAYAGNMKVPPGTVLPVLPKIGEAVQPADLGETEDIQLTPAIRAKAAELQHNPSAIFRWVHDTIEYIPTYGSVQGADYTLQTKRGNAFDTSSLLIALLRASGIPARYVYGTVEVPMDKAMNWVGGVTNPTAVLELMGQGGIPNIGLTQGGQFVAVRMEHVWVEAFVDYVPSRGTKNLKPDTWLPLDASFKQYTYTAPMNLQEAVPFDAQALVTDIQSGAIIDETLGYVQNLDQSKVQTVLTNYQAQVKAYLEQQPNATVGDVLGTKTIKPYPTPLLTQVPMKLVFAAADFQALPETMRHYFHYNFYGDVFSRNGDSPAFVQKLSLPYLAGKALALSFRPATPDDEATINSYLPQPHVDGTPIDPSELPSSLPGYLINVTPELTVDSEVIATGDAVMLGSDAFTRASITSPNSSLSGVISENAITAGEYHAIAVDGQGLSTKQLAQLKIKLEQASQATATRHISILSKHDLLGGVLQAGAQAYFAFNDVQSQILAKFNNTLTYRLPSYGSLSSTLRAQFSWGIPKLVSDSGVTMDMDHISSGVAERSGSVDQARDFRLMAGTQMSSNENLIPEQIFSTESKKAEGISAVKVLQIAARQGQRIFTLSKANLASTLPALGLSQSTKDEIANAVNAGYQVTTSQQNIQYAGWIGAGYIILDPETQSGAYKISGGQNGAALVEAEIDSLAQLSNTPPVMVGGAALTQSAVLIAGVIATHELKECLGDWVSDFVIAAIVALAIVIVVRAVAPYVLAAMAALAALLLAQQALASSLIDMPSDCLEGACEQQLDIDLTNCQIYAGTRWGPAGYRICESSAHTRYGECLSRGGPQGITTPLHGVDTPL